MGIKNGLLEQSTSQWVTVQKASEITGKSENAIGILIRRRRIDRVKKINGSGQGKWLIHRDSLEKYMSTSQSKEKLTDSDQSVIQSDLTPSDWLKPSIPLEHYETKRDEWDQERDRLMQGLMMYRFKFEELDKQIKLLPAPPEVVSSKLEELELKEAALTQAQKILRQSQEVKERYKASLIELRAKLQEEEKAKEALRLQWELAQVELSRPWWKKLFGIK